MASRLQADLCCPVCQEVFRDPVVLLCSHSFCKVCLQTWWRQRPTRECPVCQKRSPTPEPPCNLVLKNLCESFLLEKDQRSSEDLCSLHSEKLKLFCLDHQEPVCLICRDSEKHNQHRFRPIDEVTKKSRRILQENLGPLKKKLRAFEVAKTKYTQLSIHIQLQARRTERQIKEQFKKLHHFLEEEEEARLCALREEEERKSQRMKEQLEALSREMAALSDTVRDTEELLKAGYVSFLKGHKAAVERVQQRPLLEDPQLPSGALIEQAKHLGNLGYNIWIKMKDVVSYSPVVLDPNTAGPELILSDDLTCGIREQSRQRLCNPERSKDVTVLGSESFSSGTRVWDIEVEHSSSWTMGVLSESAHKFHDSTTGLWGLGFNKGEVSTHSPSIHECHSLSGLHHYKRIRVYLDMDEGQLTFMDAVTDTHIHTFTDPFTERMFPTFTAVNNFRVCPMKVCVTQQEV